MRVRHRISGPRRQLQRGRGVSDYDPALADPRTRLRLEDGWHAAMSVDPRGNAWPWLIAPEDSDDTGWIEWPSHELTGPLPAAWLSWAWRCNALTRAGTACRNRGSHGGRCARHADSGAHR